MPPTTSTAHFSGDIDSAADDFPHFWEHTVGSGHATLALRADWQKQLTRCHQELGFKYVRFHGILSDDMGTLMCENDQLVYSFFNVDQICDFLLSIGMKPFVELSFMPSALSSGSEIVFHYKGNVTPPRDYAQWEGLLKKLVKHWLDRYGEEELKTWFFEIWNEPNLKAFWTGTQQDYFRLYESSARAIKSVHADLKVGGPATADNAWIPEFISFCEKGDAPVDFISTHHYPTDAFGKPGDDTVAQLAASHRSVLREEAKKAKSEAGSKPLYYTEWSTSSNPFDELHDLPYAAAFITKTVMEARGTVEAYSYWTFSDIFEENYFSSQPFHGGFGLMNIYGVPKPAYRAYELLHRLGDKLLPVLGTHQTVDAWVTKKNSSFKVLFSNSALPRHPVQTEFVEFSFKSTQEPKRVFLERIDDTHSSPAQVWKTQGSPGTLSQREVQALESVSAIRQESIAFERKAGATVIQFAIPAQGVVCLSLEF
jgi:xylan 1,4-beta-xylosidase